MSSSLSKFALVAALTVLTGGGVAQASPINTGDAIAIGSIDSAWVGYDITNAIALQAFVVKGYTCCWMPNQANASWISPVVDANGYAGNYPAVGGNDYISWTETVSLTSNEAASDIKGRFAVDNGVVAIIVNGFTILGINSNTGNGIGSFTSFTSFDIPVSALHVGGGNTFEFLTVNLGPQPNGNPTGLMVEFTQVPEPLSAALLVVGMTAVGVAARRRRVR